MVVSGVVLGAETEDGGGTTLGLPDRSLVVHTQGSLREGEAGGTGECGVDGR